MMPKFMLWPDSELDRVAKKFLERKGIDPNEVTRYQFDRSASGTATITLTMIYDEGPPMADVTGLDKPPHSEFLPTTS